MGQRVYNLKSVKFFANQVDKFFTCIEVLQKLTGKGRSGGNRMLLLHTAHNHTEMLGLYYNSNSKWLECILYTITNLYRKSFLNLQTPCKCLGYAGKLTQTGNVPIGYISNMCLPKEW